MIVTLIRLVYHDAASIRLKLEVADAVKFYVFHYVRKHNQYLYIILYQLIMC